MNEHAHFHVLSRHSAWGANHVPSEYMSGTPTLRQQVSSNRNYDSHTAEAVRPTSQQFPVHTDRPCAETSGSRDPSSGEPQMRAESCVFHQKLLRDMIGRTGMYFVITYFKRYTVSPSV
jgi:hypothetical protein